MPLETGSYAQAAGAPKTVADYQLENQQVQQNALNMQRGRQQLDAYTQDQAEKASLRNYLSSAPDLSSATGYNGLMAAAPTLGAGVHKTYQDSLTAQALAKKDTAQAGQYDAETATKKYDLHTAMVTHGLQSMLSAATPDQARQAVQDGVNQGYWSMQDAQQKLSSIPTDPAQYSQWRLQQLSALVSAKDQLEASKPVNGTRNTGNTIQNTSTDPFSGAITVNATTPLQATPGEVLSANTSRSNNAANIAKDYKVAGLDANGNFAAPVATADGVAQPGASKNPLDGLVDSIGTYGLKAETALSRMPPAQKAYVMSAIASKYPDYDPMNYTERQAGIHSFSPNGNNGKTVQALNVSVDHLAKFRDLATALDNGDNRLLNTVGNTIAQWTGNPAPNNFEAAKNIVMDEVTKGVIGAAGGQGDREKMAGIVSKASSPADLAGAIDTITGLMGGRLDGVQKSYESSTQRKDFAQKYLTPQARAALERANGGGTAPAATIPTAPSGFKITHVDGKPQ